MVKVLSKDYRVKPGAWGESKQRVQIMLTPTAIERVDALAETMKLTRAEVIERLIRSDCLDAETLLSIDGGDLGLS
jgi:metal-responsive CopG/Arc/MetJ family transcriptional regulator